ncbi:MAG TPA: alkaline phosphatase family protein [bacterium]|jgi:predicted AlkP superfamily phosphohydrolase/phosphomutase
MSFLDKLKTLAVGKRQAKRKVVVLGSDGMDSKILEKLLREGRMPNMAALAEQGGYSPLKTTTPAESPVAWSSFTTGTNPGKHGIFDFLTRNPKTYTPEIAPVSVRRSKIGKPEPVNNQHGKTLWKIAGDNGFHSTVIRVPVTFPPEKFNGRLLSGLGVPDLRGTWGTSVLYEVNAETVDTEMGGVVMSFAKDGDTYTTEIYGPKKANSTIPLRVTARDGRANIEWQENSMRLEPGVWSEWKPIYFEVSLGPITVKPKGIMRFYLHSLDPLKLYLSPICLDPGDPFYPVTHPQGWARDLVKEHGNFCTLGWMEDTWGLNEGRIHEHAFLEETEEFHQTVEDMALSIVEDGKDDFFICVFEGTDRNQHMFWRFIDHGHPMYNEEDAKEYGEVIYRTYERFDQTVGKVRERIGNDTILMCMSDHGFNSFRRAVNVNTWLWQNGYLVVDDEAMRSNFTMKDLQSGQGTFWPGVDWSKSKAYALGLGKIYINLKGRESRGCVDPGREYESLRDEIIEKFSEVSDEKTGKKIVSVMNKSDRLFSGEFVHKAGDIVIGFVPGYRVSWQTALGGIPESLIEDNARKWSADHCSVNADFTSGILVSSEKYPMFEKPNGTIPEIIDLAPTILQHLGIDAPSEMDGVPLQGK